MARSGQQKPGNLFAERVILELIVSQNEDLERGTDEAFPAVQALKEVTERKFG